MIMPEFAGRGRSSRGSIPSLFGGIYSSHHVLALLAAFAVAVATEVQAAPTAFVAFPNNSTHSSAAVAQAISNVPTNAAVVYDALGLTNDIQVYNFGSLVYVGPIDVGLTLNRIRLGYSMVNSESDDGGFFNFKPGELPNIPRKGNNYYMEFMVWYSIDLTNATYDKTVLPYPSVTYPGPMRLLIGMGGEVYFTGDHYGSGLQTNAYYVNPPQLPGNFAITNIAKEGNNIRIGWQTVGGLTNVVQAMTGWSGDFSNRFIDISPKIVAIGGDLTGTNYLDAGGATNSQARYYRVRLVQ